MYEKVVVTKSRLDSLAVTVSEVTGEELPLSISEMNDAISNISHGISIGNLVETMPMFPYDIPLVGEELVLGNSFDIYEIKYGDDTIVSSIDSSLGIFNTLEVGSASAGLTIVYCDNSEVLNQGDVVVYKLKINLETQTIAEIISEEQADVGSFIYSGNRYSTFAVKLEETDVANGIAQFVYVNRHEE